LERRRVPIRLSSVKFVLATVFVAFEIANECHCFSTLCAQQNYCASRVSVIGVFFQLYRFLLDRAFFSRNVLSYCSSQFESDGGFCECGIEQALE